MHGTIRLLTTQIACATNLFPRTIFAPRVNLCLRGTCQSLFRSRASAHCLGSSAPSQGLSITSPMVCEARVDHFAEAGLRRTVWDQSAFSKHVDHVSRGLRGTCRSRFRSRAPAHCLGSSAPTRGLSITSPMVCEARVDHFSEAGLRRTVWDQARLPEACRSLLPWSARHAS